MTKKEYDKGMSKILKKIKMPRRQEKKLVHLDLDSLSRQMTLTNHTLEPAEDLFLGGILRKARESRRLTIAQISDILKIKEIYLNALENGQYYVFPGLTYGAGFLRSYARFLELDERHLSARFYEETSNLRVPHAFVPAPQKKNKTPTIQLILRMILLIIVFYISWYLIAMGLEEEAKRRHLPVVDATVQSTNEAPTIEIREDSFPEVGSPLLIEEVLDTIPDTPVN